MASHNIGEKSSNGSDPTIARSEDLLNEALFPNDSYTSDGTYWADLPRAQKWAWVNSESNKEAARELSAIGRMFRADPLEPFRVYFHRYFLNGMGLFVEGFVLFSIGNLQPLFSNVWPQCWSKYTVCDKTLIQAASYTSVIGIIIGQIGVGIEGDWIGRKFGLVQDALIMFLGVVALAAVWGSTLQGWVIGYVIALFFYGCGVGGEYPMTSTRALESGPNGPAGTRDDRLHRGRNVVLAFLDQGWGQVFNQGLLMVLLVIFHGKTSGPYTAKVAQYTYRISFGVIATLHLWLLYHRVYQVKDADKEVRAAKKKLNTSGYDSASLKLTMSHYWHRLLATAGGWFAADFLFYGNKIFAGTFIAVIHPGADLFVTWEYNFINIAVSLVGYYLSAILIDHKFVGRKMIQQVGFFFNFILFLLGAIFFKRLTDPTSPSWYIKVFQFMYFLSSFFQQFGPNCVTFLVAAEVYPASIRATAHGFSAACGKLGALAPTVLYNYIDNQTKFWVVPWFALIGAGLTFLFLPDTTGLDLREQERYWACVRSGRVADYAGQAINPQHLSWYERVVLKRHRFYDPVKDKEQKANELRQLWESSLVLKETGADDDHLDHSFVSPEVARYFEIEKAEQKSGGAKAEERRGRQGPDEITTLGHSNLEDTLGKGY